MRRVRSSPESDGYYDGEKLHGGPRHDRDSTTWIPVFFCNPAKTPTHEALNLSQHRAARRNTTLSFGSMVSSLCDGSGDRLLKCLSHEGKLGLLDLHLDWDVLKDDNWPQRGLWAGNHLGVQNWNPWSEPVTFLPSPECGSRQKLVLALVKWV